MSSIRYGVGNLDIWEQFGIGVGFSQGGVTLLACLECGHQDTAAPGDRPAAIRVAMAMLEHVARCPPKGNAAPGEGPLAAEIVDRGVYRFYTAAPEVNNDSENDAA